jgi:hypothetical protein
LEEVLGHDEATVMLLGMGAILTFPLTVQQIVAAAIS